MSGKPRHGHATREHGITRTYASWSGAKQRSTNPNHPRFEDYGMRGILMSESWLNSFETFLLDMRECPEGLSLERKDNDRGYCKENCIWATSLEQAANKRKYRNNTVGYTGVSYYSSRDLFMSYASFRDHRKTIGYFKTPEEAYDAREKWLDRQSSL